MLVYKYRGGDDEDIFNRDLTSLKNNLFFAPKHEKLNDPCEALILTDKFVEQTKSISFLLGKDRMKHLGEMNEALHEVFSARKDMIGIYSLSKIYNDELLWAHYADSHRGFCIEYDLDELLKIDKSFGVYSFDVKYSKNPHQYTMKDMNNKSTNDIVKKIAGYKSSRWEYEQEYRIVTDFAGDHPYNIDAIKAIYFGLNMDEKRKQKIVKTLKGRGITYYQIKLISKSYKFERELIYDFIDDDITYFKEIPNEITKRGSVKFNILKKEYTREDRASIEIEIENPVSEESLSWLAHNIKADLFKGAKRIYIFYYLKEDLMRNYCWATTNFSPELEIKIMGATEESFKALNNTNTTGEIISTWINNDSMTPSKIFLTKENDKLYMKTRFAKTTTSNGSEIIEEITNMSNNGVMRLDYDNGHGEYFVIEENDNLGLYNGDGKFCEAIKEENEA